MIFGVKRLWPWRSIEDIMRQLSPCFIIEFAIFWVRIFNLESDIISIVLVILFSQSIESVCTIIYFCWHIPWRLGFLEIWVIRFLIFRIHTFYPSNSFHYVQGLSRHISVLPQKRVNIIRIPQNIFQSIHGVSIWRKKALTLLASTTGELIWWIRIQSTAWSVFSIEYAVCWVLAQLIQLSRRYCSLRITLADGLIIISFN